MKTFRLALAALFGALAVGSAGAASEHSQLLPDDSQFVAKAAAYLESLTSAEGRFEQTDARGVTTEGTFYLRRPGRIRFEYDPPATMIVVSDGHNVTVYDSRLKTFNAYPLGFTPLHVFLAKNIRLDKGVVVDKVDHTTDGFSITAHGGPRANEGSITLDFAEDPTTRLTGWTITDARGARTHVALTSLKPVPSLNSKLFTITNEPPSQPGR
jgi:outer membrane lipoprotein-sorting protein